MSATLNRDQLTASIIDTVVEAVNLQHFDRSAITADTSLTQGGLQLDSVDILEVVVSIEHRFGVKVGGPEAGKKYFRTFGTIADFIIEAKQQAAAGLPGTSQAPA